MTEVPCPACGAPVPPHLPTCGECGAPMDGSGGVPFPFGASVHETVISGGRPAVAPPPPPLDDERTMVARDRPFPAPPPPAEPPPGQGDATVYTGSWDAAPPSGGVPTMVGGDGALPGIAPAPPPPAWEEEPVTDGFDVGDDEGGSTDPALGPPPTLEYAGALPPPAPAPPPPAAPPPPRTGAPARLEHWSPRVKGEVLPLEKEEVVVGRDRGDFRYPEDAFLSRRHARFFRDGEGRLLVEDLGTLNGTYLKLHGPRRLEHRDVLLLGRHVFRFELLQYDEKDDRTLEGDPLTRVQGVQGAAPRARLVKRQEDGFRGMPFFFGVHRYVLGRTDGTHNFQKDDRMSRRHAALSWRDGSYWIEDLGSQNGTFVRVQGPHAVGPGDVVLVGDQYFRAL